MTSIKKITSTRKYPSNFKPIIIKFHSEALLIKNEPLLHNSTAKDRLISSDSINEEFKNPQISDINMTKRNTKIVDKHKIESEDSDERNFLLQLHEKKQLDHSVESLHLMSEEAHQPAILMVDDTIYNLIILEKYILSINKKCLIEKAYNGQQAIEKVLSSKKNFDLILMDCNMPVLDGYKTTEILKKMMKEKEIGDAPIVAVSAYNKDSEQKKCLESGMVDYLEKPITKDKFEEFWKKWMEK